MNREKRGDGEEKREERGKRKIKREINCTLSEGLILGIRHFHEKPE